MSTKRWKTPTSCLKNYKHTLLRKQLNRSRKTTEIMMPFWRLRNKSLKNSLMASFSRNLSKHTFLVFATAQVRAMLVKRMCNLTCQKQNMIPLAGFQQIMTMCSWWTYFNSELTLTLTLWNILSLKRYLIMLISSFSILLLFRKTLRFI